MKVIDRDNLTNKAEILYQHTESGKIIPWSAVRVCEINNIKTVDAEVVRHGRWEPQWEHDFISGEEIVTGFCCSLCDCYYIKKHNYCPNCGTKMDGGKQNG